jgi:hypothetical protein
MAILRAAPLVERTNEKSPLIERVTTSFQQLSLAATDLNQISDNLRKVISTVDDALKSLNLGVSAWVNFRLSTSEDEMRYWYDQVGYDRIDDKWGLAIRSGHGDETDPDHDEIDNEWLFNDAPRTMRLGAIDKLPDLLDQLKKSVESTANSVRVKMADVELLALVLSESNKKRK